MMNFRYGTVGLKIPQQRDNPDMLNRVTTQAISDWRRNLPMADTGETSKKIYSALREINQTIINPKTRSELLELIRPPTQMICQSLKNFYYDKSKVIDEKKLSVAKLAQTLQHEIAYSYKIIIEDCFNQNNADKKLLANAIYRTMYYLMLSLHRCYLLYSNAPENLWQEIHILYRLAKEKNLLTQKLGINDSIEKLYLRILILSATNPFQWQQNEQEAIFKVLHIWQEYVILRQASPADCDSPGKFLIDINSDTPPGPASLEKIKFSMECETLDLLKLSSHIESILNEIQGNELQVRLKHKNNIEFDIYEATLSKLFYDWTTVLKREQERFKIKGHMHVAFGLSTTYDNLINLYINKNSNTKKKNLISETDNNDDEEVISLTLPSEEHSIINFSNKIDHVSYICELENINITGLCLLWQSKKFPPVQPGEIIALQTTVQSNVALAKQEETPWEVGVIKWMKHTEDGKTRMGIKLLAPRAIATRAQVLKNGVPAGYSLKCLLLPKVDGLGLKETLVTPTFPFREHKNITLTLEQLPGQNIAATLSRQISSTASYRQFEYITDNKFDLSCITKSTDTDKSNEYKSVLENNTNNNLEEEFKDIWDCL